MRVEVRPLPVTKWHGKKNKESFAQPKTIEVLYNDSTGVYDTGLTDEEAEKYGKILGVSLDNVYKADEAHPTWSSKAFWIPLPNSTVVFETTRPMDYVKVKIMKASKFVANTYADWEAGKYEDATHYIYDEEEQAVANASKTEFKLQAYEYLGKMTEQDKLNVITLVDNKSARGRSLNYVNGEIGRILEEDPSAFLKFAKLGRPKVTLKAQIVEMLLRGILTKEGMSIYYMGSLIGADEEEAVKWFEDPNNSRQKIGILDKLEAKVA